MDLWSPLSTWGRCGSCSVPSPSRGSPGCLPSRQGLSVSGFVLSVGSSLGLVLQVLVRLLYHRFFLEISWCQSNLQRCVPPRGLSLSSLRTCHEICAFLLFLVEPFPLPGHCSSSSSLPRLDFPACSTFFFQVSHSKVALSLSFPSISYCWGEVLDLLCSSVCRLHCTNCPNVSKITLGNCWVQ